MGKNFRLASNVYFIAAFATLGGMLFGFDISSISGVIGTPQYNEYFNYPDSTQQGGITASMPGGSFLGALASGILSDKFSRKYTIQLGAIVWCIGAILQCASQNIGMLVVGRFIAGIAVGLTSSVVPVYQSEIAPKNVRGRIVSLQQWAITWGIMIRIPSRRPS
jgi:MFS family permease